MTPQEAASLPTLMALWSRHKRDCRPVGQIVVDARAGRLPGVVEPQGCIGFRVVDEAAAMAAMKKVAA